MDRRSPRSTCSRPSPGSATRSRSCSTATGSRPTRCSASPAGRTCPRRRSCSPPTDAAADYRVRIFHPEAELPFAGHPTLGTLPCLARGGRHAAGPGAHRPGVRRRASSTSAATATCSRSRRRRCSARARSTRPTSLRDRRRAGHRPGRRSSTRHGADNGPGWAAILLASADGRARDQAPARPVRHRHRGAVSGRVAGGPRASRGLAAARRDRGGPGDGQPQRVGRPMADLDRERSWRRPTRPRRASAIGRAGRVLITAGRGRDRLDRRPERDAGPRDRRASSGARGGWSRPCRRGCAGSTASRGGPGRGGRPRCGRSAGCGA